MATKQNSNHTSSPPTLRRWKQRLASWSVVVPPTRGRWRRRARPDVALATDRRSTDTGSVEAMTSHLQSVRVSTIAVDCLTTNPSPTGLVMPASSRGLKHRHFSIVERSFAARTHPSHEHRHAINGWPNQQPRVRSILQTVINHKRSIAILPGHTPSDLNRSSFDHQECRRLQPQQSSLDRRRTNPIHSPPASQQFDDRLNETSHLTLTSRGDVVLVFLHFQVRAICICFYSVGVASHSPGLPANAGYPGMRDQCSSYPERVVSFEKS